MSRQIARKKLKRRRKEIWKSMLLSSLKNAMLRWRKLR
jgi:hypothetical protein